MSATQDTTRRGFHTAAIIGLTTAMKAALAVPAAIYLLSPAKSRGKQTWTEAGTLSELQGNEPTELVFRRKRRDGWKDVNEKASAWVQKVSETELIAFAPSCTHLGCAFHWDKPSKTYVCPCHTSAFGPKGEVLAGPAPRPLDRYEVKVEGNKLLLGRVVTS